MADLYVCSHGKTKPCDECQERWIKPSLSPSAVEAAERIIEKYIIVQKQNGEQHAEAYHRTVADLVAIISRHGRTTESRSGKSDIAAAVEWLEHQCDYGPPCGKCHYCTIAKTLPWFDSGTRHGLSGGKDIDPCATAGRHVCGPLDNTPPLQTDDYRRGVKDAAAIARAEFQRAPSASAAHDSVWMGGYESACDHLSIEIEKLSEVETCR